jgi:hypothetical protein
MLKFLPLLALIAALTACSNGPPLTACKGPVFQLNADHWQVAPTDLAKPAARNG